MKFPRRSGRYPFNRSRFGLGAVIWGEGDLNGHLLPDRNSFQTPALPGHAGKLTKG